MDKVIQLVKRNVEKRGHTVELSIGGNRTIRAVIRTTNGNVKTLGMSIPDDSDLNNVMTRLSISQFMTGVLCEHILEKTDVCAICLSLEEEDGGCTILEYCDQCRGPFHTQCLLNVENRVIHVENHKYTLFTQCPLCRGTIVTSQGAMLRTFNTLNAVKKINKFPFNNAIINKEIVVGDFYMVIIDDDLYFQGSGSSIGQFNPS